MLDSRMVYSSKQQEDETSRRQSSESALSSKAKKLSSNYVDIAGQNFESDRYQRESKDEDFLCQKFEDLIEHVKAAAD